MSLVVVFDYHGRALRGASGMKKTGGTPTAEGMPLHAHLGSARGSTGSIGRSRGKRKTAKGANPPRTTPKNHASTSLPSNIKTHGSLSPSSQPKGRSRGNGRGSTSTPATSLFEFMAAAARQRCAVAAPEFIHVTATRVFVENGKQGRAGLLDGVPAHGLERRGGVEVLSRGHAGRVGGSSVTGGDDNCNGVSGEHFRPMLNGATTLFPRRRTWLSCYGTSLLLSFLSAYVQDHDYVHDLIVVTCDQSESTGGCSAWFMEEVRAMLPDIQTTFIAYDSADDLPHGSVGAFNSVLSLGHARAHADLLVLLRGPWAAFSGSAVRLLRLLCVDKGADVVAVAVGRLIVSASASEGIVSVSAESKSEWAELERALSEKSLAPSLADYLATSSDLETMLAPCSRTATRHLCSLYAEAARKMAMGAFLPSSSPQAAGLAPPSLLSLIEQLFLNFKASLLVPLVAFLGKERDG